MVDEWKIPYDLFKTWTYTDSKGVVGKDEADEIIKFKFLNAFKDAELEQDF